MPNYVYECLYCNKLIDKSFPITDKPDTIECEHCESECKQIINYSIGFTTPGGNGFYNKGRT